MASILFYSPFNQRSRDTESLMIAFRKNGHKVISLTQQEGCLINDFLRSNDIKVFSHVLPGKRSGWWYFLRHLFFLIRFCHRHRIDIVYSHLEPANFVASIGQYFIGAKTYLCRHHIDEGKLYSFDKDLYYRLTYRLAKKIIVVSDHARQYMIEHERIPGQKIIHINLAYDFSLYARPDEQNSKLIRNQHQADILLVMACRLTGYKRPEVSIHVLKALLNQGLSVKLIILGKGEMAGQLESLISELDVQRFVCMKGYVSNVLDYMAAADFLLHPSLLDSSCVVVKEAGIVKLPVIVCSGVGDFNDYIVHGVNGFSVHRDHFVKDAAAIVKDYYQDKNYLNEVGSNLGKRVVELFSIENVIHQYDSLNANK